MYKRQQISLSVTTLFWGAGAVLQFLVLKWCDHALGMDLSQGAVMQAVVSLGIAVGAFLAAAKVPLKKSLNVLPMGICMGVLVVGASYFTRDIAPAGGLSLFGFELSWAVMIAGLIMILVGICAGFFVVPMNALLQHRGHVLMSAGRSIAVQNFNENWKFYLGDASGADGEQFDDSAWKNVDLPHDYSIDQEYTTAGEAESGYKLGGIGWYRKNFKVDESLKGKSIRIDFDGVYMDSTVWINGHRLGNHPYGYSPFSYDITEYLRFGELNTLSLIHISSPRDRSVSRMPSSA